MKIHAIQLNDGTVRVIRIPTANSDPSITADEKIMIELDAKNRELEQRVEELLGNIESISNDFIPYTDKEATLALSEMRLALNALPEAEGKED